MRRLSCLFLSLPCALPACVAYTPRPVSLTALAQPAASPLPAGDPLAFALAESPAVAAARLQLAAARHDREAAKRLPATTLTLSTEYSRKDNPEKPWLYSGLIDVPLDLGERRSGRITSADVAVDKAVYALEDALWTTRQALRQAQGDLAFARESVALNQQIVEARIAYRDAVLRQVTAGEETRSVADQASIDLLSAQQTLRQAEVTRDQAVSALGRAVNADPAAASAMGSNPSLSAIEDGELTALTAKALYARSDIHQAVADYDTAENDLRLAVAGQYPDVHVQPGYTWERGIVKLPLNWTLTLPPTDLNRANIEAATNRRAAAGKTLEDKIKTAGDEIAQATAAWRGDDMAARQAARETVPQAQAMAGKAERSERAGEAARADTLLARIALLDTELAALSARQSAANDRLKLEDALRQPFDATDADALSAAVRQDVTP